MTDDLLAIPAFLQRPLPEGTNVFDIIRQNLNHTERVRKLKMPSKAWWAKHRKIKARERKAAAKRRAAQ